MFFSPSLYVIPVLVIAAVVRSRRVCGFCENISEQLSLPQDASKRSKAQAWC